MIRREKRSHRLNFVVPPSFAKRLKKFSALRGLDMTGVMEAAVEEYMVKPGEEVKIVMAGVK